MMSCPFTSIRALIRESRLLLCPVSCRVPDEPIQIGYETDDRLYCWVLELFEFPESKLKEDMKKFKVKSLV